ncbi:HD domain-containing protein [Lacrimispora sp. 210928-DFI.3.58]|uniref:HD domain-containing protein n=1 Tax=Lacrimispora sp. 210928-DFI.3.58 TaxID=2883214 RepID=UPI0015B5EDC7|nr:HD domain-containing protein [Lacrimispora sp. 210928-DFI.3.58]MCB7318824.1 HD domain-containing protein [Lacrimispora sp. 210928-DFI.3.58]
MIEAAVAFAAKAHEGAFRKGTSIPYITHPLETAVIVSGFTDDEEMIAAALLHDVVEDAGVTRKELEERFGTRVADLVMEESEDKSKSWQERKSATIDHLALASREAKILALGDKLSNMRCTARDYLLLGDGLWERFNEKDKGKHAWYYWGIARGCRELEEHVYYKEYIMLCQSVFGSAQE